MAARAGAARSRMVDVTGPRAVLGKVVATVFAAAALAVASLPAAAANGPVVWTLPSLARVAPTGMAGSGTAVSLAAARGETESFQVVVRAGAEALQDVTIGVTDLTGPDGATIAARDIALFREQYVEVKQSATPNGAAGWYPDALVPFRDELTGRAPANPTVKAQGVTVEPGHNQPFWVDVLVGRNLTPGTYEGGLWVKGAQGRLGGGRIKLQVYRAQLPEVPGLRSSFNQWTDHSLAADEALIDEKVMPLWIARAGAEKLAGKSPLNAAGLGFWGGAESGTCRMAPPPSASEIAQRAASFPRTLLLYDLTAQGVTDCPQLVETVRQWGRALHQAGVANLVAAAPVPELLEDPGQSRAPVDIWVVTPAAYHKAPDRVRAAQAAGAQVWAGMALADDPEVSPWLLDASPLGYRLTPGFSAQSLGFTGVHYWAADRWSRQPWADVTYRSADGRSWPGEGVLVYPGAPAGVAGVVPSVRLKWIRDGVEDYDLIALARARGVPGLAKELELVAGPAWKGATTAAAVLEAARRRLLEALEGSLRRTAGFAGRLARVTARVSGAGWR